MKRYDSYKDSGVQWIGEVPSHWEGCRFKNFLNIKSEKSNSSHKVGLENIESQTGRYVVTDTEFDGDGVGFHVGDILYGKLRPYLQKVWLTEFDGNAVGDFFVFACKPNSNNVYVKYLMLSDCFTKEADGSTFGAKMPRVASDFILTLPFYLPPINEQTAIANYLDNKCSKIDNVIATQEKRVELLRELKQSIITRAVTRGINPNAKMKDSGVEWIGEIPEHWEVTPLKHIIKFVNGFAFNSNDFDSDGDMPVYRIGDIANDKVSTDSCVYVEKQESLQSFEVKEGDILLAMSGATTGKIGLVSDQKGYINQRVGIIRSNIQKWVFLSLKTSLFAEYIYLSAIGSAQPNISTENFGNYVIALPPKEEMASVVDAISRQTTQLDSSITKALRQIELLKEYKQSLITEVVTGKRKVC